MDKSSPEKNPTDLKLSDLRKVHKTASEITDALSSEPSEPKVPHLAHLRRQLMRKVWEILIPREKEHKKEVVEAIEQGLRDPLTGLYNRKGLTIEMVKESSRLQRAEKSGENIDSCIVIIDVNRFKEKNDGEGGHAAGDRYLQQIALALTEIARPTDTVARTGGDEFALILPTASTNAFKELWKKRFLPELLRRKLSLSVGVANFNYRNVDQSLSQADRAMYQAKQVSRLYETNEMHVFGEQIT